MVLELGSGGGNNATHLRAWYDLTLSDLSEAMLAVSREQNPGIEHIHGDMRTLRIGRDFDAVFVHDALMYLTEARDLTAAMATAFAHCRPGGVALFVPDCTKETFAPATEHGGEDASDGRAVRYLEWTFDPDPNDTSFVAHYTIVLRECDRSTRVIDDRHECGLFAEADWVRWLRQVGFSRVQVFSDPSAPPRQLFLATRP